MAIEFTTFTNEENDVVRAIANRARGVFGNAGIKRSLIEVTMDISAVHAKCPLRLHDLLAADDFNFTHDLGGIYRHLNRDTGELENCFVPRFAAPSEAA